MTTRISNRRRRCDRCRSLTNFAWAVMVRDFRIWVCDACLVSTDEVPGGNPKNHEDSR